jgi:hypothetical protein
MSKTAMQDLISALENFKKFPMLGNKEVYAVEACIEFAILAIESEKQQIVDSYDDGKYYGSGLGKINLLEQTGIEYYQSTYESNQNTNQ